MDSKTKNIPYHVGIIMDGNRRWAKKNNLPTLEGHRRGYDKIKKVGKWCKEKGVKILTVWGFSTENWLRSKKEVEYLMRIFKLALSKKEIAWINKENIRLRIIGQKERFSKDIQKLMAEAERETKNNTGGILNLALSYGGRAELLEAVKKIAKDNIPAANITEKLISDNLWTAGQKDPDLIIRTSGERRTSGFLLWQSVYSELYFCKKFWPDFEEKDLDEAFLDYASRERRFGK
ncbi:MAG: polyprenyl diphosphate synthase [Candidatus Paceibacterota bacterium]|jgi:undecaprenyl diphosphate synthase